MTKRHRESNGARLERLQDLEEDLGVLAERAQTSEDKDDYRALQRVVHHAVEHLEERKEFVRAGAEAAISTALAPAAMAGVNTRPMAEFGGKVAVKVWEHLPAKDAPPPLGRPADSGGQSGTPAKSDTPE